MRVVTWNINSVRLRIGTLERVVKTLRPDVVCLQETKAIDELFPMDGVRAMGFEHAIIRGMKGYNGVAILSRLPMTEGERSNWCDKDDCRHVWAKFKGGIELHNFYVPAGGDEPDPEVNPKFAHKLDFLSEMTNWSESLDKGKRIMVGDFNIAPYEHDVWSHKALLDVVSHTPVETEGLIALLETGWVDAVRKFVPTTEKLYTWWSYRNRTWPGEDRGRRLDHIWVTPPLAKKLDGTFVLREARGWERTSDHVPVAVDIEL